MSRRLSQERNKKSIQIKRILDFSISVGDETAGENIRGYELLISPKRRGITKKPYGWYYDLKYVDDIKICTKNEKKKKNTRNTYTDYLNLSANVYDGI